MFPMNAEQSFYGAQGRYAGVSENVAGGQLGEAGFFDFIKGAVSKVGSALSGLAGPALCIAKNCGPAAASAVFQCGTSVPCYLTKAPDAISCIKSCI
ncbi:hypothetical protein GTO89_02490 [Heliobacterium gestii]|uniref:Uncharacterized protein n=1 Tax=Heliomicrobium gestii TaxID=2699 RepID=A0A845L8I9_HELGE|nr:hypothetical protein [Heliomicrobium gestii]MBM7865651.1 hypothetical protein [Heliomicrobium gestii]MZP41901.1 hypothetical protein [Heliomicrobium gestii]